MKRLFLAIGFIGLHVASAQTVDPTDIEPAVETPAFEVNQGVLQLDTTSISGNRELPKVLAIVPWKKSLPAEDPGRPLNSLLTTVIEPVDREELKREAQFHQVVSDQFKEAIVEDDESVMQSNEQPEDEPQSQPKQDGMDE